jgi:beta-lactamase superfamily II metal-dependent hydrolase
VDRYRHDGATVLRTDQVGAVGFEIDRDQMLLWTGREVRAEE